MFVSIPLPLCISVNLNSLNLVFFLTHILISVLFICNLFRAGRIVMVLGKIYYGFMLQNASKVWLARESCHCLGPTALHHSFAGHGILETPLK